MQPDHRSNLWVLLSLLLLWATSGCAPKAPIEPDPAPSATQPSPLGTNGSLPIVFQRVIHRIPSGTILGEARMRGRVIDELRWTQAGRNSMEFNVGITDRMRQLGYDMRDAADAVFDPAANVRVRFEMAAIVHDAQLEFEYEYDRRRDRAGEGVGQGRVEIEVKLHDTVRNKTVYSRRFYGTGEDRGLEPNPVFAAVVDAVAKAAMDPEFVKHVSVDATSSTPVVQATAPLVIRRCDARLSKPIPEGLEEVLQTVVSIQVGRSEGTGVLISPDGWVLSAAHVVDGADEVWIRLSSGVQLPATVARINRVVDLVLLRIKGRGYPCSPVDVRAQDLEFASELYAFGSPMDDSQSITVTRGVLSGYTEVDNRRYIQTDASVNPGSSGGPLVAPSGTVAGVTIAKAVGLEVEGIGFAVPAPDVIRGLGIRFVAP